VAVICDNLNEWRRKIMKKIAFLVLLGLFLLAACGGTAGSSADGAEAPLAAVPAEFAGKTNPLGAEAASDGAAVFQTNCSMCHGPQGAGDGPAGQALDPKPKDLAALQKAVADDYLFWRIHDGKPGTSMVAWMGILTEEQIWQTVSFIRTLD
jgi:mono/diheme cytochrome c family protein